MSKHDRKIIDVRDLFGQPKQKSERPTSRENGSDLKDSALESPKIVQTSNSDIFFGNNAKGDDVQEKNQESRKKRHAPAPPVLVDIDVGYLDQLRQAEGEDGGESGSQQLSQLHQPQQSHSANYTHHDNNPINANGFMNSYNIGGLQDGTKLSLDQSSSGVETDDNVTPNGTIDGVPKAALPKDIRSIVKVEKANSNGYHSEESEDNFEEEECTLDFGEEEETVEGRYRQIYKEYQGEDYAKYLNDDGDEKPSKGKRRFKKKKSPKPAQSPTSSSSTSSGDNSIQHKGNLQTKIGQMFYHSHDGKFYKQTLTGNTIQNFSYSDSKIGNDVADNDLDESLYGKNPNVRYAKKPLEDPSRINRISSKRWWNKDTLSAHTLSSHSDILLKARKNSTTDIDLQSSFTDPGYDEDEQIRMRKSLNDSSDDFRDFESYRKNRMYDVKSDSKKSGGKKGFFKKISRSFNKKEKPSLELFGDNATVNPLRQSNGDHLQF